MALKKDPILTLRDFHELTNAVGDVGKDKLLLMQFVNDHFDPPGSELEACYPEDWHPEPLNFRRIKDYRIRRWALAINKYWHELCRRVKDDVRDHPELFSLLYVPHNFIIPGGRFREFYYWDSYWIVKGLLFSEMYATSRGVMRNLAYMVENYGFVPNGGRVYYMTRSQPPLLSLMVNDYYIETGDIEFVYELLPTLEKEYNFWLHNRGTLYWDETVKNPFKYFQYKALLKTPRPESYREDLELVHNISDVAMREMVWSNIASAAETGWDFSTRWFDQEGPTAFHMQSIRTWHIIPVDLNAFMCMNARILANLFEITGNFTKVLKYQARYQQAKRAMRLIHWNEQDGIWYDYDVERKRHIRQYYISNALPLFAKCYDDDDETPLKAYQYFKTMGAFNFSKGVPTSIISSGQQWDHHNAWPPMVHMLIEGFRTSGDPFVMKFAEDLAVKWMKANYNAYIRTHQMYEKYNITGTDKEFAGSGGEYEVQTGFGWTNGVVLDIMAKYGDILSVSGQCRLSSFSQWTILLTLISLILNCGWLPAS